MPASQPPLQGQTLAQLGTAAACSVTDAVPVSQGGGALLSQTFSAIFAAAAAFLQQQPELEVAQAGGTLLLNAATHNKKQIVFTAPGTVGPPTSFASFGPGSSCEVINLSGGNVVFSLATGVNLGGIFSSSNGTLANGGIAQLRSTTSLGTLGTIIAQLPSMAAGTPTMAVNSITNLTVGATATATFSFSYGVPTSVTATLDGSALTIAGISINSGTGTGTFTFTAPAAGSHTLVVTGTGGNTASSAGYGFTTTAANSITVNSVSPLVVGGTSTCSFSYTGPAPTSVTATSDASALTITVGSISAGTGTFTFTAPAAGSHALIVTGTGANTAVSPTYNYTTAANAITVTGVTPLTSGSTATASFNYTGAAPTSVTATLGGSALTIAGVSISGGSGSFTFTQPAAGTYALVVTGTGANTASSSAYSDVVTSASSPFTITYPAPGYTPPCTILKTYTQHYFWTNIAGATPASVKFALSTSNTVPPTVTSSPNVWVGAGQQYGTPITTYIANGTLSITVSVPTPTNYYLWIICVDSGGTTWNYCYPTPISVYDSASSNGS